MHRMVSVIRSISDRMSRSTGTGAPADRICHDAVDPDRRQSQGQCCEEAEKNGAEARARNGIMEQLIHRPDLGDRQLVVQRTDCRLWDSNRNWIA